MNYEKLKKGIVSLALLGTVTFSTVALSSVEAQAQGRYLRWERQRDRQEWSRQRNDLRRLRQLDRNRQLRYRYQNNNRIVGYYDRFGRFQAYGYYDRFGRLHRY